MSGQSRQAEIVVDQAKWEWSELYKKEDWWAIWLGIIILIVGLIIFLPRPPADMDQKITQSQNTMKAEDSRAPFHTLEWHRANDTLSGLRARNESHGKTLAKWLGTPARWASNPMEALILTEARAAEIREGAKERHAAAQEKTRAALAQAEADQAAAANAAFQNTELNKKAEASIAQWRSARSAESRARSQAGTQAYNKIPYLFGIGVIFMLFFAAGTTVMNINTANFIKGFGFVFLLAIISEIIGANSTLRSWGFGPLIWAILGGMLIANTIGTPQFIKDAAQTEYFIKTGLVLLGAEILFGKILAIGLPGIFVAWVVTPTVLVLTFIFGQKVLKIESKTLNITVSSDMCVCGVSAAIATAAACRATKEELTIAIGMSMLFTAIMMIALPTFIVSVGMHPVLGGAWIGGTIDSTGAVVAAGAFLGETGMFVAATIKMIQNIMIGAIAFGVAVYWCAKVDCVEGQTVKKMEIWYRFPKFVLGFIAASIVFSIMIEAMGARGDVMLDQGVLRGFSRPCREWFFILAFASIGLTSNFREMAKHFTGGKPVILYVCGQSLNLALTLLMAYIMFFLVFPDITASL
ncbi:putative integral membrane protein (TIGR00698 family) [Desulfobotulus alkaliphilus]|uniref:Putative integral membrane protein (TIGR00698 family) n=1 Tax=Desulfobotulus alkaliphilus TaxID=622671 RepID=A0A562RDV5_9BACT|nr:putative sulfate exporter family transporter [Desulfobotulus alkaliphilus]TWI67241.1 putative integral membrane protein (TIGR00698 family) [Desulfobotulus alkaliphilus]